MGKGREGAGMSSTDSRLRWLKRQLESTLRIGAEEWEAFVTNENPESTKRIQDFFEGQAEDQCAVIYTADTMIAEFVEVAGDQPDGEEEEEVADLDQTLEEATENLAEAGEADNVDAAMMEQADGTAKQLADFEPDPYVDAIPRQRQEVWVTRKRLCVTLCELPEVEGQRVLYLIRNTPDPILEHTVEHEMDAIMNETVEAGVLAMPSLIALNQVLSAVYMPVFSNYFQKRSASKMSAERVADGEPSEESESTVVDFHANVSKFGSQLVHAIQQVAGEVQLKIPDIPDIMTTAMQDIADDQNVVDQLTDSLEQWTAAVSDLLEAQSNTSPQGKGPLAEIDYWRDRSMIFGTVYEQLHLPVVQKILSVMGELLPDLFEGFSHQHSALSKQFSEAKDNVKFLSTLERHFKNLTHGSLSSIVDSLPSMLNAIRMVWVISRNYNTDERMVPLMERIANEIADRVAAQIDIHTIFRRVPADAMRRIEEGKRLLEQWHEAYSRVRRRIERSQLGNRWEFDVRRLFDKTDYMAQRCEDLYKAALALEQFHNILGKELKEVTGDADGINRVMKDVENLVHPLENVAFDVFDKRFTTSWDALMNQFNASILEIEENVKHFINSSFKKLRSAEGAFEMLRNFKNIKSREAINKQMSDKFGAVMMQYLREVDLVRRVFELNMAQPPCTRNQPPVAGAIRWSRSLFRKVKKPMLSFQSYEEMMASEEGEHATKTYVALGKSMRDFENNLYKGWLETVDKSVLENLKQNILKEDPKTKKIEVNFHRNLVLLIRETRYLDRMGFTFPETALNVALQADKYFMSVQSLNSMLASYHAVIEALSPIELSLISLRVEEVKRVMKPGMCAFNWSSLGIAEFISQCTKAISLLQSYCNQMKKSDATIATIVSEIATDDIVPKTLPNAGETLDLSEFFDLVESHRHERIDVLLKKYQQISSLLIKIEEVVDKGDGHKVFGKSKQMREYYKYWERQIYKALSKMLLLAMTNLKNLLCIPTIKGQRKVLNPVALFKITAYVMPPDIGSTPPVTEIRKVIGKLVGNIVSTPKQFVRWYRNQCIEAKPEYPSNAPDDEPVIFSFYSDLSQDQTVLKIMLEINQANNKTFSKVKDILDKWRKHFHLWRNAEQTAKFEKFAAKDPSCIQYDDKLQYYARKYEDIGAMPHETQVDFIKISNTQVMVDIQNETQGWIVDIALHLAQSAKLRLDKMDGRINQYQEAIRAQPGTLDELKQVLSVIAEIREQSTDVENDYIDIEERYRTLGMYGQALNKEEVQKANEMRTRWLALLEETKTVQLRLRPIKKKFAIVTQQQVEEFNKELATACFAMKESGPASPEVHLEVIHRPWSHPSSDGYI
jgi:dynein heavy chain